MASWVQGWQARVALAWAGGGGVSAHATTANSRRLAASKTAIPKFACDSMNAPPVNSSLQRLYLKAIIDPRSRGKRYVDWQWDIKYHRSLTSYRVFSAWSTVYPGVSTTPQPVRYPFPQPRCLPHMRICLSVAACFRRTARQDCLTMQPRRKAKVAIPPYIIVRRITNVIGSESEESGPSINDATDRLTSVLIGKSAKARISGKSQPAMEGNAPRVSTAAGIPYRALSALSNTVKPNATDTPVSAADPIVAARGIFGRFDGQATVPHPELVGSLCIAPLTEIHSVFKHYYISGHIDTGIPLRIRLFRGRRSRAWAGSVRGECYICDSRYSQNESLLTLDLEAARRHTVSTLSSLEKRPTMKASGYPVLLGSSDRH